MGNKLLVSAAVGALVGAAAVVLFWPAPRVTKVVSVTSAAPSPPRLSVNPLTVSASKDQVEWQAIPPTAFEYIEFEQKVFANADPINGRFRVSCVQGICNSGKPLVTLPTQPPEGYLYWYGLKETETSNVNWGTNGRIIIIRP